MKIKGQQQIAYRRQQMIKEAKLILETEGIEGLSMRRLAQKLQQTPGIVYHYFKNKDELLLAIVQEGYGRIIRVIQEQAAIERPVEQKLYYTLKSYMEEMLKEPQIYQIIMQSQHPLVKENTYILFDGICQSRSSIQGLCDCIEEGVGQGIFVCSNIERRAQSIWCSMYGFLERCICEKPNKEIQQEIMEELLEMLLAGLRRKV